MNVQKYVVKSHERLPTTPTSLFVDHKEVGEDPTDMSPDMKSRLEAKYIGLSMYLFDGEAFAHRVVKSIVEYVPGARSVEKTRQWEAMCALRPGSDKKPKPGTSQRNADFLADEVGFALATVMSAPGDPWFSALRRSPHNYDRSFVSDRDLVPYN